MSGLLSDEQFFGTTAPKKTLSDDEFFAPRAMLSDAEFFGDPKPKGGSFLPEVGKGVAAGTVSTTGTMIKGASGQNDAMLQSRIDNAKARIAIMDTIDRGGEVPVGSIADGDELDTANVYRELSPEQRKEFRRSQERVLETAVQPDVTQSPLYQAGQSVQDWSQEQFAAAKDYEGTWTRAITEGLGSTIPWLAAGVAGRGGLAAGTAAGSFASSGEALDRAVQAGATKEQIIAAIKAGGLPGLTEQVPIETLFNRIPLPLVGKFTNALAKIAAQAAVEGGQEAVQQVMQNMIARYQYKPDQDLTEGVAEAASIGAIIGGGLKTVEQGVSQTLGTGEQPAAQPIAPQPELGVPEGAADADVLFGAEPDDGPSLDAEMDRAVAASPLDPFVSKPLPEMEPATELDRRQNLPEMDRARDIDRPDSPRLTPEDRASPLPNDIIDDGKAILEDVLAPKATAPVDTFADLRPVAAPPASVLPERAIAPQENAAPLQAAPVVRQAIPRRDISPDTAVTSSGREIPVKYAVVEASSLVASQRDEGGANPSYPAELQPRDRDRAVSAKQVNDIAQKLNPRLLDKSPRASDGAPIVSADGVVESGNGRVLAIRRAYADNLPTAQTYKAYLGEQGYPVDGMTQPVLVRVREGEMAPQDRMAFTREANERDTLGMSATERAMADASAMSDSVLSLYRGGDIDAAANRDFVRGFMQKVVSGNDQAAMVDSAGVLSQDAIRRVQASLLAKAYDDSDLVGALVESTDTNIKAIGGAMMDVAADWAQMRSEAQSGQISSDVDQTGRLLDAIRLVQRARRDGRNVAEYVGQTDIFSGSTIHPVAEAFLRLMFRNNVSWTMPAGRDKLADALRFYVTEARKTSAGVDLLGEPAPGPDKILGIAKERQYGQAQEQAGLDFRPSADGTPGKDAGAPSRQRAIEAEPVKQEDGGRSAKDKGARAQGPKQDELKPAAKPDGPRPTASWVIRNKATGEVVMETFDRKKVDALNTKKYEAVPIQEHLASLNKPKPAPDGAPFTEDDVPAFLKGDKSEPRFSRRAITDTDAFSRWFGNSKVVDENGEPMVVYHGTRSDTARENFRFREDLIGSSNDTGHFGRGIYFARFKGEAEYYGPNVVEAYLSIKNPLDLDNNTGDLTYLGHFKSWAPKLDAIGALDERYKSALATSQSLEKYVRANARTLPFQDSYRGKEGFIAKVKNPASGYTDEITISTRAAGEAKSAREAVDELVSTVIDEMSRFHSTQFPDLDLAETSLSDYVRVGMEGGSARLTEAAKAAGHDGIFYGDEIVAFSPTQIKSATGNRGTFDPADPRINYSMRQGAAIDEQIVGGTVQYRLSPEFVDKAEGVRKALRQKLDAMGLPGIGLRVWESMRAAVDGKTYVVEGQYLRGLIDVALEFDNPDSTLHHEALHAMKALGLFTDNEWSILSRKSNKEWRDKYQIAENYGMFDEAVQIEEGIAAAFTDWIEGARMDGLIAASFRKMKVLLKGLYQALTGIDIASVDDIFQRVASGQVGKRPVTAREPVPATTSRSVLNEAPGSGLRTQSEIVDTVDGPREQLVIPGAEKISDKTLAERKMEGRKGSTKAQKDVGGLPLFSDEKDQMSLFQVAWHGTPHDFDEFSTEKIGTGEGAQVFGWGLYFAGKRDVAEYYREKLKRVEATVAGYDANEVARTPSRSDPEENLLVEIAQSLDLKLPDGADPRVQAILDDPASGWMQGAVRSVFSTLARDLDTGKSVARALDIQRIDYDSDLRRASDARDRAAAAVRMAVLHAIEDRVEVKGQGKLYEVSVPENKDLLVWDKDLADQTPELQDKVRAAFKKLMPDYNPVGKRTMSSVYTDLMMAVGHADPQATDLPRRASEALREAGIPGHRYLDQGSRADGDGSYNYVIYDDRAIKIEARFKMREATKAVAKVQTAARAAVGSRIMDAIKRGKNDGETVGQYSHRKLIDYLHPLRTMIESAGGTVQDTMNAYLQARMADDAVVARIQDMHGAYVTPMVEALAKSGASLEDLHKYLYARHAPERNRVVGLRNEEGSDLYKAVTDHDIKGASGWSTNEAKKVLRGLRADPAKFAGIQEAARLARQMLDTNLADQRQAGLISAETYDLLTKQWQHYVPLRSQDALDENGDFSPNRGRGFDVRGDEFQAATGRFSEAENIPAWAIALAERTHMRSEHNNVGKAVLRFLSKYDPKGEKLAHVYWSGEGTFGDIEKAPSVHRRVINSEGKAVDKVVPPSTLSPAMFAVKDGGRTYYVQFADEKVGIALKNMGVMHLDAASRLARKWTGFQSLINTRANPAFVPINIIRDAATGGIHLLDEGFTKTEAAKIVGSIPKAWGALWRNARGKPGSGEYDTALKEYIGAGGKITFEPHKTLEDTITELRKQMKDALGGRKTTWAKLKAIWNTFAKFIGDLNDAGENGMRLAAYIAAREKGRSVKQAAFLGRDLTVDFKKHGEIGPLMNSWFVFFNASIQGNYNIASRLLKSKKVRRAAYMIAASGVLVDLLNRSMSGDDDDEESFYSKMLRNEPWKFERQMVIFYGSEEGDYFTIPLPYGYNAIYHMGVQASAAAFGDVDPVAAVVNATRVTWDAFNPIGSGGSILSFFAPTVLEPLTDIYTNTNFSGAPITPTKFPGDYSPYSQNFHASTPDNFRRVAEFFNWATGGNDVEPGLMDVSPDTYEHLWGYVVGGIGRFFGQSLETGEKIVTGKTDELEWENIPIARSFIGKFDDDGRRAEYYRLREEVQTVRGQYVDYLQSGRRDEADDLKLRKPVEVDAIGAFDGAEKQLRRVRKAKRAIDLDDSLTRAEKDEKLKPIEEIEMKIMNSARLAYSKLRREQN